MYRDGKIWIANTEKENGEQIYILPQMANRHGLVCGATGTGKTVTLKVLAESFSDMGVPVFMADVKGDIASMIRAGEDSEGMQERIRRFGLAEAGFAQRGYPVTLWDLFGKEGIQLRTTITEIGPLLLSRILQLNDLQSDILTIVFKIADDNGLLLIDTKDLKAILNYVDENRNELAAEYGKIAPASLGAITRAVVALELDGGETFFGEPALNIHDWLTRDPEGHGMINILASDSLISNGRLYSTFLLWLLSELFESLPEIGDPDKPRLVFFFDEAHLLFNGASKTLLDKIEQVVKLIRSKGVGVYFCTQNPRDIPDGVLAQLGNKIEHGLRAYTPAEQKSIKAAAESFRENPAFDTIEAIKNLGTGEAVVSFLDEDGTPGMAELAYILPPQSSLGTITDEERAASIRNSLLHSKYAEAEDRDSAFEFLQRRGLEIAEQKAQEALDALEAKEAEMRAREEAKQEAARLKEEERQRAAEEKKAAQEAARLEREEERQRAAEEKKAAQEAARLEREEERERERKARVAKNAAKSVAGTIGREVGKTLGGSMGRTGKLLGGNLGATLGRGIMDTLFKR